MSNPANKIQGPLGARQHQGTQERGIVSTQPPNHSLQRFIDLAQELRDASENRDYRALGNLLADHLRPDQVSVMVYIRSPLGHLTITGGYSQLWNPQIPAVLAREPTILEIALVLRAAARR
jgi:hypothetical protein